MACLSSSTRLERTLGKSTYSQCGRQPTRHSDAAGSTADAIWLLRSRSPSRLDIIGRSIDRLASPPKAHGCRTRAELLGTPHPGNHSGRITVHSRNVVCEASEIEDEINALADQIVHTRSISVSAARSFLVQMRCELNRVFPEPSVVGLPFGRHHRCVV